ncbi:MAG: hypothetical protein Q4F29_01600 [Lachnospiraceae bacterium]|nr:hypothetical protein [Lachnospiraceae bacterium]
MGFAFFINRGIEIKGLYMDDLYLWSCWGEQSFWQYVFPIGSTRFRFLFYLAAWLELAFTGPHVEWMVPINILLNGLLAVFLYNLGRRFSGRGILGFFIGILFLLSRMSYYQIGQVYGLMETMALWMAIGILYGLFVYLNEKQEKTGYFYGACWLYFGICFVHERYMALLPLFFLVLLMKRQFQAKRWFWPLGQFLLVQLIRWMTIGSLAPAGTGGTQVSDTFSFWKSLGYAVSQVAYVFGINAGPEHLNGLAWADTPLRIRGLVYGADLVLALFFLLFLVQIVKNKEKRGSYLSNTALFLVFIAMCIGSSSVTVRVEMRWVYVSYAAALLFLTYICGVLAPAGHEAVKEAGGRRNGSEWFRSRMSQETGEEVSGDSAEANFAAQHTRPSAPVRRRSAGPACFCVCGVLLYLILSFPAEIFFRGQFPNLYLWPNQMRYNSLAEETYGRYGKEIFGKTIYIIGNSYEMSEFTAETFFKVFDKERKAEGTKVEFIDSIRDIGLVTDQMLVLREDEEHNGFQDITQFVKHLKFQADYGIYQDGWMDESCSFSILSGAEGRVSLKFLYPGTLSGGEETKIYVDGALDQTIPVTENIYQCEIEAEPYQTLLIQIENNYYLPDALEQRGEKKLTAFIEMEAE